MKVGGNSAVTVNRILRIQVNIVTATQTRPSDTTNSDYFPEPCSMLGLF